MKLCYTCPKCGTSITLHVTPSEPPTCSHNNRTRTPTVMEPTQ